MQIILNAYGKQDSTSLYYTVDCDSNNLLEGRFFPQFNLKVEVPDDVKIVECINHSAWNEGGKILAISYKGNFVVPFLNRRNKTVLFCYESMLDYGYSRKDVASHAFIGRIVK